jgi:hypothetical protein
LGHAYLGPTRRFSVEIVPNVDLTGFKVGKVDEATRETSWFHNPWVTHPWIAGIGSGLVVILLVWLFTGTSMAESGTL